MTDENRDDAKTSQDTDSPKKAVKKGSAANDNKKPKAQFRKKAEKVKKPKKPVAAGRIASLERQRIKLNRKRYILTSAQNNTYVHDAFLKSLESYAQANDAQLIVSLFTYNKNGYQNGTKDAARAGKYDSRKAPYEELWYDPKIKPYVLNESAELAPGLVFGGELDILPTAANPISGMQDYFGHASGIIPHAKHAMESEPRVPDDDERFIYTTGACTKRNYIQRKAGQKAEAHHTYGALVVEVDDDGDWFVRQIVADDNGAFYDLTDKYLPSGEILHDQRAEAIQWGDVHIEKSDPVVLEASFGSGGILDAIKPKHQFFEDLVDFQGRNHHSIDDPYHHLNQFFNIRRSVKDEFRLGAEFLKAAERPDTQSHVVPSNHDGGAFVKWLKNPHAHTSDPLNFTFWHASNLKKGEEIEKGNPKFDIFEWAIRSFADLKRTDFLEEGKSFTICKTKDSSGIECALHGHQGPDGSRGSPRAFRNIGRKANTGHTHKPGIINGVYTAGVTGKYDMDYNRGPTTWSHSHILTYPNGKRTILTIKKGKWRAEKKKGAAPAAKKRKDNGLAA